MTVFTYIELLDLQKHRRTRKMTFVFPDPNLKVNSVRPEALEEAC